jgi:O-Antigen ligase
MTDPSGAADPWTCWADQVRATPWRRGLAAAIIVAACGLGLSLGLRGPGPMQVLWLLTVVLGVALLPPLHRSIGCWAGLVGTALVLLSCWAAGAAPTKLPPLLAWLLLGVVGAAGLVHAWAGRALLLAVSFGLAGTALITLGQSLIGFGEWAPFGISSAGPRFYVATGTFPHWTSNGTALAMGCFALLAPRRVRRSVQVVLWLLAALCLAGCVLSQSRAALLALLAGGGTWVALQFRTRLRLRHLGLALVLLVMTAAGLYLMHRISPGRVESLFRRDDIRLPLWRVSGYLIAERPWLGLGGPQGWKEVFPAAWSAVIGQPPHWLAVHAHHLFLGLASFYGIPATLAYATWLGSLIARAWRSAGSAGQVSVAILAAYLVGGQFEAFFLHQRINEVLVLLLAALWLEGRSMPAAAACA